MMWKARNFQGLALVCLGLISGSSGAVPLANPGDYVAAEIFAGTATNTSGGNPKEDGQGWYRKDMITLLSYYTTPTTKWATSATNPGTTYSEITNVVGDTFRIYDEYAAQAGVAWVYTNQVVGRYVISCTNITSLWQFKSEFLVEANAGGPYVTLSGTNNGNVAAGVAYTNWLGRGGKLAFRGWNNNNTTAAGRGAISGLRVTLLEVATNTPAVTLSSTAVFLPENPLQGTAVVTVALSQVSTSNVTINLSLGGTAVKDTDYTATSTQVVIQAGDLSGSIVLTSIDNTVFDGNKTVIMSIGSLVNATNGASSSVMFTRTDDEAPLLQKGDVLKASIFMGTGTNTSGGNPNPSGQGWYRRDLTNALNYYSDSTQRWATAVTNPLGLYRAYSEVIPLADNSLRIMDFYNGQLGVGWVYTNQIVGDYVISCANIIGNSRFCSQFLMKSNAAAPWVALSSIVTGSVVNGISYTNGLDRGGQLAFKVWVNNTAVENAVGTVSDLKVTLISSRSIGTTILVQ